MLHSLTTGGTGYFIPCGNMVSKGNTGVCCVISIVASETASYLSNLKLNGSIMNICFILMNDLFSMLNNAKVVLCVTSQFLNALLFTSNITQMAKSEQNLHTLLDVFPMTLQCIMISHLFVFMFLCQLEIELLRRVLTKCKTNCGQR